MIDKYEPNSDAVKKTPPIFRTLNWIIVAALLIYIIAMLVLTKLPRPYSSHVTDMLLLAVQGVAFLVMIGAIFTRIGLVLFKYSRFSLRALMFFVLWVGFWIALMVVYKNQRPVFVVGLMAILGAFVWLWGYTRNKEPH